METLFRAGLRDVRVHTGPAAAEIADRLGARAVTAGRHILFAAGEYAPRTRAGRWLLAHELAHVLQQRAGGSPNSPPTGVGPAADPFEREADRSADAACAGRAVPPLTPDPTGLARRVVRPDESTATITTVIGPGAQPPLAPWPVDPTVARFQSGTHNADGDLIGACLTANGSVVVNGDAGDSLAGWRFGFVQVQWIETSWADYRGARNEHGSAFIQRGRTPARPTQACRDTTDGTGNFLFYANRVTTPFPAGPAAFPQTVAVNGMNDTPGETFPLQVTNDKTGQLNFLNEAQLEFHFLLVFAALSPANRLQPLAHLFWNLHWQARFRPASFVDRLNPTGVADFVGMALPWGVTVVAGGTTPAPNVSRTFRGAPVARTARERAMVALLDPALTTAQSCSAMANQSADQDRFPPKFESTWVKFNLDR